MEGVRGRVARRTLTGGAWALGAAFGLVGLEGAVRFLLAFIPTNGSGVEFRSVIVLVESLAMVATGAAAASAASAYSATGQTDVARIGVGVSFYLFAMASIGFVSSGGFAEAVSPAVGGTLFLLATAVNRSTRPLMRSLAGLLLLASALSIVPNNGYGARDILARSGINLQYVGVFLSFRWAEVAGVGVLGLALFFAGLGSRSGRLLGRISIALYATGTLYSFYPVAGGLAGVVLGDPGDFASFLASLPAMIAILLLLVGGASGIVGALLG